MAPIEEKFKAIRLLVLDFDGVFTDNHVWIDEEGKESVVCDRGDSLGIKMLKEVRPDIRLVVISKETSRVVNARCQKLKIECYTGIDDKPATFQRIVEGEKIPMEQVAFMGNDVNDLECIRRAGIGIAVADAVSEVKRVADYVTRHGGGRGAIRECTDIILGRATGDAAD